MTERLLQFIWQFQYFNKQALETVSGEKLEVVFAGEWNKNQGPDFKQARIKIGETLWAGEVEIHLKASDWAKHHHTNDTNYSKIVLHVVWENDIPVKDATGLAIPALELSSRVSNLLLGRYQGWMEVLQPIACSSDIAAVPPLTWASWKSRLVIERLQGKSEHIFQLLYSTNNNWEEVFWRLLCRYFGAPVNSESFEQLAASLPLNVLAKHKSQLHQVESLLLGQAGLLQKQYSDHYPLLLQREYKFLQQKHQLVMVTKFPVFLRMRPANFPTVRLAQLAMLIHQSVHLFSQIKEATEEKSVRLLFNVTANDFWNYHFKIEEESAYQSKDTGDQFIDMLLINVVCPTLFAYGKYMKEDKYCDKAIAWLEALHAEKNGITKSYTSLWVENKTAFDSQALLHLRKNYCDEKRCLECAIGNSILKRS